MSDEVQATMIECLEATLAPEAARRREAEKYLQSVEFNEGFLRILVEVMMLDIDQGVRQAAAITFKNTIKRRWSAEENAICDADKKQIKENIIPIMISTPDYAQKQICTAISLIAKTDFPFEWQELLDTLKEHLESDDFHTISGVLQAADPIFWKYRYAERSDELWTEIGIVLEHLAQPLTTLFQKCLENISANQDNLGSLGDTLAVVELIVQIFYSLNSQDIPAFFEDHLQEWSDGFLQLLRLPEIPELSSGDSEIPGIVEKVKSQIARSVSLYAQKYDEEFTDYLASFVECIWNVLTTTSLEVKNDYMVCTAMNFLSLVASRKQNTDLFSNETVLKEICEKVVVPNIGLRESDTEIFNFNPDEYLRRDFEGSDVDTRRRSASDLVRALCLFFEKEVTAIFSEYVNYLLEEYHADQAENWVSKDSAIFLVIALAVRSKTARAGTTKTNDFINIEDFFLTELISDLEEQQPGSEEIIVADALKFLHTFRGQLSAETLCRSFPAIVNFLVSDSNVVNSYAASCVERLLHLKRDGVPVVTDACVEGCLESLLTNLFGALALADNAENEYVMKAIMRTIVSCKEAVSPYIFLIIEKLTDKLLEIAQNPGNARFNHYLFESIGCSIRFTCAQKPELGVKFEESLFPPFQKLIEKEVEELQPYIFQVMAQLLEIRSEGDIPDTYLMLFPLLINPELWESGANTIPLVRFLQAFVSHLKGDLFAGDDGVQQLEGILGVFQRLIASKVFDLQGFALMQTLIEYLPIEMLESYLPTVIKLILTRMSKQKTANFVSGFITFACFLSGMHGPEQCIQYYEQAQRGLFAKVLKRIIEDVGKVSGDLERKICVIGLTRLFASDAFVQAYKDDWASVVYTCACVVELPADEHDEDAEDFDNSGAKGGYAAKYVRLAFAGKAEYDPFRAIEDVKAFIGQSLSDVCQKYQGLASMIPEDITEPVQSYLAAAGVDKL